MAALRYTKDTVNALAAAEHGKKLVPTIFELVVLFPLAYRAGHPPSLVGSVGEKTLSTWRYRLGVYTAPLELKWAQRAIDLRKPKAESL